LVPIESRRNKIIQFILQTLGGGWLSSRPRRLSPPLADWPPGRERQYLNSGMQETIEISDYMPLFFEDFFLLFFFVGIYLFTQSNSFNLP